MSLPASSSQTFPNLTTICPSDLSSRHQTQAEPNPSAPPSPISSPRHPPLPEITLLITPDVPPLDQTNLLPTLQTLTNTEPIGVSAERRAERLDAHHGRLRLMRAFIDFTKAQTASKRNSNTPETPTMSTTTQFPDPRNLNTAAPTLSLTLNPNTHDPHNPNLLTPQLH